MSCTKIEMVFFDDAGNLSHSDLEIDQLYDGRYMVQKITVVDICGGTNCYVKLNIQIPVGNQYLHTRREDSAMYSFSESPIDIIRCDPNGLITCELDAVRMVMKKKYELNELVTGPLGETYTVLQIENAIFPEFPRHITVRMKGLSTLESGYRPLISCGITENGNWFSLFCYQCGTDLNHSH